jgi:hypothetical protein
MSGSGGGYSGGAVDFVDACEDLVITTQLSSPKDAVVQQLQVGDILNIALHPDGHGNDIVVALYEGQIAGGVTNAQILRLKSCMQDGTIYVGEVLSILGGQVKVRIKAIK